MSKQYSIDTEKFDSATLRMECAFNMLTLIHDQLTNECDRPANDALAGSVYGVYTLVSDAYRELSH